MDNGTRKLKFTFHVGQMDNQLRVYFFKNSLFFTNTALLLYNLVKMS